MRKLKLDVDDLRVRSFSASSPQARAVGQPGAPTRLSTDACVCSPSLPPPCDPSYTFRQPD